MYVNVRHFACSAGDIPNAVRMLSGVADSMWIEIGEDIAGARGVRAVQLPGVSTSHPVFPIFSTALATMPSLASGLTVQLWGPAGKRPSVVVCPMSNGNYSQTRIGPVCGSWD